MRPTELSIAEAGVALRSGQLTSEALTEAHLTLIAETDDRVRAFVAITGVLARAAALRADRDMAEGIDRGPLHGIPFALKDIIDLEGVPTTCGSAAMDVKPAARNAAVTALLLEAGAVPLGKLATYEFALVGPSFDGPNPPARNPWNADRITGGSSSGSAAAVAAGLVRFAVGTDTGGSVRSPAAYCGVVGLKPTYGAIPCDGVFPLSHGLDHVGILGSTVADTATVLGALTGVVPGYGAIEGKTIGFARDWFADDPAAQPGVIEAVDAAVSVLTLLGARVRLVDLPDYRLMEAAGGMVLHAEALGVHRDRLCSDWPAYGRQARQSLAAGVLLSDADLALARLAAVRLRGEVDSRLADLDALVTATTLTTALPVPDPAQEKAAWSAMRTLPFNVTGHPAISVPCGFVEGLPVGLQIVGMRGAEATICRIAAAFEGATDHSVQRPPNL